MEAALKIKNWQSDQNPEVLKRIHENDVNIAIFDRNINTLNAELDSLTIKDFEFRSSGDLDAVSKEIAQAKDLTDYPLLKRDIKDLIDLFSKVIDADNYRLFLATINSNMCRKFHTDVNDLRMLCTYKGQGTLWLTEDNINPEADNDEDLVIDESRIQQVETGSVVVLKGAIYPKEGTTPVLHRSPAIEEGGEKRLLLRIDTDEFANF